MSAAILLTLFIDEKKQRSLKGRGNNVRWRAFRQGIPQNAQANKSIRGKRPKTSKNWNRHYGFISGLSQCLGLCLRLRLSLRQLRLSLKPRYKGLISILDVLGFGGFGHVLSGKHGKGSSPEWDWSHFECGALQCVLCSGRNFRFTYLAKKYFSPGNKKQRN